MRLSSNPSTRRAMSTRIHLPWLLLIAGMTIGVPAGEEAQGPAEPQQQQQQQLPHKMHARMSTLPTIKVGHANADITGTDNRALQAAVDYVASLERGTVEIGPGEY